MAVKIPATQIQNLQQMEVTVAGPEDANRLIIVDGQFDCGLSITASGPNDSTNKETFSALVGSAFTRKQFVRANAIASLARTQLNSAATGGWADWEITNVDADWDDESGQVEQRIEAKVTAFGANHSVTIAGFLFHVTILAAVPAA
jgi:hypothetical protein